MISKFDKSCASALYKRKFGECLDDYDYEGALDCLHKFSAVKNNPDFHMACGMLYLLMTQDSDDSELLTLAFREFMMQLRRDPDNTAIYRNILATVFLRREPVAMYEWSKYLRESTLDSETVFGELARAGINQLIPTDSDYLDLESLFNAGDFGMIDPRGGKAQNEAQAHSGATVESPEQLTKANKIIKFRGGNSERTDVSKSKVDKKIVRLDETEQSFAFDQADLFGDKIAEQDAESLLDLIKVLTDDFDDADGLEIKIADGQNTDVKTSQLRAGLALQEAEIHSEHGDYAKALEALDKISPSDGRFYYCGECVRAFILLETNDISGAQKAVNRALDLHADGALAGTLLCRIYELTEQFDKIPRALKKIDVKDFVDSDHVYKAMRYAIKYCTVDDALDLAEEYIEEYNIMDVRMLYAQMLYNSGDKEGATEELYSLSRIFYDDFNTLFYNIMSHGNVDKMPLSEEAPQEILGMLVDDIMSELNNGLPLETMDEEMLSVGLETFVTLEFDNDRRTMIDMFGALRKMTAIPKLKTKVLDSLVSPYVEPLVKSVMLSELYAQGERDLLFETGYCPVFDGNLPKFETEPTNGMLTAYAFVATLRRDKLTDLIALADKAAPHIKSLQCSDRDIANYLIRKVRGKGRLADKSTDVRIDYALGYTAKTAATQAYKTISSMLDPLVASADCKNN